MDEKFKEDRASSTVNEGLLEQHFHIDTAERRREEMMEIREMRRQLEVVTSDTRIEPDTILYNNIERANELLDTATRAIENGGETSARMYEVCAQLINAITSATASITGNSFNAMKHEYNMELLRAKNREIDVKEILAKEKMGQKDPSKNGKVIVMDRESLLKMMEDESTDIEVKSSTS